MSAEVEDICPILQERQTKERGVRMGVLAEPVNLLTNIAFFAATIVSITFAHGMYAILMSLGISVVGLMSTIAHAKPNRLTFDLDKHTIILWVLYYDFCWAHFMAGYSIKTSLIIVGFIIAVGLGIIKIVKDKLRGNADYIPVLLMLATFGVFMIYKDGHTHFLVAMVLALGALLFRSIDFDVKLPSGTHFMWHILNGFLMLHLTLYFVIFYSH